MIGTALLNIWKILEIGARFVCITSIGGLGPLKEKNSKITIKET